MEKGLMTLSPAQEKIMRVLNTRFVDAKQMAEMLGRGYDEQKVRSMVLTLARKGVVPMAAAALMLRGTPMYKMLSIPFGSNKK